VITERSIVENKKLSIGILFAIFVICSSALFITLNAENNAVEVKQMQPEIELNVE
jgi:hypothetical protein